MRNIQKVWLILDPLRLYFENLAETWDEKQPVDRDEILARLLSPYEEIFARAKSILELGSGTGALSLILEKLSPQASHVSLDLAYSMLLKAKPHKNGNHLIESDAHKLPFTNGSFDLVICHNCFPHLENKLNALNEIKRVLKPGNWTLILHDLSRERVNEIHRNSVNPLIQQHLVPPIFEMIDLLENCGCISIQVEDSPDHYSAIGKFHTKISN